jgi:mevalonate kinase
VLDGAKAFALSTKLGQNLEIKNTNNTQSILFWKSFDFQNKNWFHCEFDLKTLQYKNESDKQIAITLQLIFKEARKLNASFLDSKTSIQVETNLSFNRDWGLGSSSTLINNIANWAKVNAFKLQFNTFGGSAYDIACAQNNSPIIYQLKNQKPIVITVNFNPKFKDQLYFVYLNKKKNSRKAIEMYNKVSVDKALIQEISNITLAIIKENSITEFEKLIQEHEKIIAKIIKIKPVKEQLFSDYFGQIKSLGAWEGDFILATGNDDTPNYFKKKGFQTVIPYENIIL